MQVARSNLVIQRACLREAVFAHRSPWIFVPRRLTAVSHGLSRISSLECYHWGSFTAFQNSDYHERVTLASAFLDSSNKITSWARLGPRSQAHVLNKDIVDFNLTKIIVSPYNLQKLCFLIFVLHENIWDSDWACIHALTLMSKEIDTTFSFPHFQGRLSQLSLFLPLHHPLGILMRFSYGYSP